MKNFPLQEAVGAAHRHLERGENVQALALLEESVKQSPNAAVIRYLLGMAQLRHGLPVETALLNLETAVRLDEQNADYRLSLGEALMAHAPASALLHLGRAIELGSRNPELFRKLALLLIHMHKPADALSLCDLGIHLCGSQAGIVESRGLALKNLGRTEEALACFQDLSERGPLAASTLVNAAAVHLDLGQVEKARMALEQACSLAPTFAEAHFNLGYVYLLEGQYLKGFRQYEARTALPAVAERRPTFAQRIWDGCPLHGERVLLHVEQGAGDLIQFARYINFVKERGGQPVVFAPPALQRLLSWLGNCEIVPPGARPQVDVQCSLLSLPYLAQTSENSIPAPARFSVPATMIDKWRVLTGDKPGMKIGLVWAGAPTHSNDQNRSLSCRLLAPILKAAPEARWFSLQVGPAATQLEEDPELSRIRDLAAELTDYAETAGALSQMDLIISVDTSVVHLAGSLGKPVWMLTPFAPDWRWLLGRSDSPWYPGMRLFRQPARGDWPSVIQAVAAELSAR